MKLNDNDLFLLSQCAVSAAVQAGALISRYSGAKVQVNSKTGGASPASQVVTEVDYQSQEIILQTLSPASEIFDLALLTEESTDDRSRLEKEYFWSIDPLDGTLPFVESTAGYAVSIALVSRSGAPLLGVIYDPLEKTLYHAQKGRGAFRNSRVWKNGPAGKVLTVIMDRSFKQHALYTDCMARIRFMAASKGYSEVKTIAFGGAAMNACWVLEKGPACYFKLPRPENSGGSLWDYAASASVLSEAGAVVSDMYGNPLDLNRADSTFMNHRGILYASHKELAEEIMKVLPLS